MPDPANGKDTARSRFVNFRRTYGGDVLRQAAAEAVRRLMAAPELTAAGTVCAYASFGTEPDTAGLISALAEAGKQVLLPVLESDGGLDWARFDGRFVPGRAGLREPAGPRLGPDAIAGAEVVVIPALAVSAAGFRLGRGGGSYDRALARLRAAAADSAVTLSDSAAWTCALVYDHELDADFPVEPHDQPVSAACAPSRLARFA
jgi:5-formyltetrahydrofolate cyclo-ligase